MKVAMMSYTLGRGRAASERLNLPWVCAFTRELGLDGVDWVTTHGHDPVEVRRVMDDHGLRTVCYTFFADLNCATAEARAPGVEVARRELETALVLGTDKIMLPIGGKPGSTREQSLAHTLAGVAQVIELARPCGLTVTVEHHPQPGSPFITSADMNRGIAELPELRVTFDSGNPVTDGESAAAAYRGSADYVVHAHFKDWKPSAPGERGGWQGLDGNWRVGEVVGEGQVDNLAATALMLEHGYDGYVDFEYEGVNMSPEAACRRGIPHMREWFEGELP